MVKLNRGNAMTFFNSNVFILLTTLCVSTSTNYLEAGKSLQPDAVSKSGQANVLRVHGVTKMTAAGQYWSLSDSVNKMENVNLMGELRRASELQSLIPFHEWVLTKMKDTDLMMPFQRGTDGLTKTPLGDITLGCYNDTVRLVEDAENGIDYAVKVRASFTSYDYKRMAEKNFYTGQILFPGDFDLCEEVRKDSKMTPSPIDSKYCLLNMAGLQVGTCWPSRCSDEDIYKISVTYVGVDLGILLSPFVRCESEVEWFPGSIATVSILALFIFIVVTGTTYHLTLHRLVNKKLKKAEDDTERNAPHGERIHKATAYGELGDGNQNANIETKIDEDLTTKITTNRIRGYGTVPLDDKSIHPPSDVIKGDFNVPHQNGTLSETDKLVEVKQKKTSSYGVAYLDRLILSTSAIINTEKFLDCTVKSPSSLCLNGLRTLSMFWIILGHTVLQLPTYLRIDNVRYYNSLQGEKLTGGAITGMHFAVEPFFFISGLLVAYLTLKQLAKNNGTINWGLFYFHRFWRITPTYMITLAVYANLVLQWGNGPLHNTFGQWHKGTCEKYWWANLLYINNLYPFPGSSPNLCMLWSWYLSCDMQLFIISPIMLILLYKSWKWGAGAIVGTCLVSFVASISLAIYWGLPFGNAGFYNNRTIEDTRGHRGYNDYIYNKPYTRIPSYLIGILFGYMMYKLNGRQIKIKSWQCVGGWLLASLTGFAIVYGPFWSDPGTPQWVSVLYLTFSRPLFTLAVAWVAFVCVMGYGGVINTFLSWTVWIPLGRLTYGAYLVHPLIIEWYFITTKTTFHFTYTTLSVAFVGITVFSYAVAFLLALLVEGPTMGFEDILIGRGRRGLAPSPRASSTS